MELIINGAPHSVPGEWQDEQLLWVLRDALGLFGTKFGCGQGQCGACTVWLDGSPQRACLLPARAVQGRAITTIEGLTRGGKVHPLQQAWIDDAVPQCGYCQAGQLMSAAALLAATPRPSAAQVDAALSGNLCRCGTQARARTSILRVAESQARGTA